MVGDEPPLSPAAMRAMAMKLLERAAEIEIENRMSGVDAPNVVQIDKNIARSLQENSLRNRYPMQALASLASGIHRQRKRREKLFGQKISNEPAWDILLDLFVNRTAGNRVSVTSACVASNSPQTTAMRYLALLQEQGLVRREEDKGDKRVTFVEITSDGYKKMAAHLNEIHQEFIDAAEKVRATFMLV